jgi:hypothetical protein
MQPPPPPVQAYQPNFAYKTTANDKKLDVTVGIIAPQFTAGAAIYQQSRKNDDVLKAMLSGMSASFNEILISKGFNTKGPFISLNDMTFPEKKGSDLLLYPEFDFQIIVKIDNYRAGGPSGGSTFGNLIGAMGKKKRRSADDGSGAPEAGAGNGTCDVTLSVDGNLLFVAQEPLSGERMWIKRLDVTKAQSSLPRQEGPVCDGGPMSPEVRNAWAKAHEIVYQDSMKSFDNYVNGEEFQMLKHQSLELRARKAY